MDRSPNGDSPEYASLRDEMLRADDQAIQLTGFALVAATFLAVAVIDSQSYATRSLLLIGFNVIILTLVIKVREKRGQQGRIAAYIRVFHEVPVGWETRVHNLRTNEARSDTEHWGALDPRSWDRSSLESFSRRAAVGEISVFAFLSLFALLALVLTLFLRSAATVGADTVPLTFAVGAILAQALITGLVFWWSRTFKELEANSMRWQRIWLYVKCMEELRSRIREAGDVLLINGGPASGKTSLGFALQRALGLDLISKDDVKESMYDEWKKASHLIERAPGDWTLKLPGHIPKESRDKSVMDWLDDECTRRLVSTSESKRPCIIDTNVAPRQAEMFRSLAPGLVEILLIADKDVLLQRYNARSDRHPVHEPRAAGDSSAWAGSDSVRVDGVRTLRIRTDVEAPGGPTREEASVAAALRMIAGYYGVLMPEAMPPSVVPHVHSRQGR